jgi:hypothetical protein
MINEKVSSDPTRKSYLIALGHRRYNRSVQTIENAGALDFFIHAFAKGHIPV